MEFEGSRVLAQGYKKEGTCVLANNKMKFVSRIMKIANQRDLVMAYTSKQNANEQETSHKHTTKPSTQLFSDQRDATNLQLKQQQLMQAAKAPTQLMEEDPLQGKFAATAPAQLKETAIAQLTRGNRARALVNQGLQDMADEEAGAADAYDEDYDEDEGVQNDGEEYEDDHVEAGGEEEEAEEAPAGYPITVNGRHLTLTAADISGGTIEPVPGRTNGDVQIRMTVGRNRITLHVHPTAGSGGSPTGGGSSLNGAVGATPGNVPQNIVDLIAAHPNYANVVASCAPHSAADASGSWRR